MFNAAKVIEAPLLRLTLSKKIALSDLSTLSTHIRFYSAYFMNP